MNTEQPKSRWSRLNAILESRYVLPACLGLALGLHLGWILYADIAQKADAVWYLARAQSIANGEGYVKEGGVATAYWPVGYPAFLALISFVDDSEFAAKLGNLALYLGVIALSFGLVLEAFRSRAAAGLTAFALAIYPTNVLFSSLILSETMYTFLTLLGIWTLLKAGGRWWYWAIAGVVFGFATLTREVGWLVPLIAVLAMYWVNRRKANRANYLKLGLVVNVAMILVIAPWTIRNYVVLGHFIPISTNKGVNLYLGNNPDADGGNMPDVRVFRFIKAEGGESEWEWERICRDWAIDYIKNNPVRAIQLVPLRFYRLFRADSDAAVWNIDPLFESSEIEFLKRFSQVAYMTIMILFVVGLLRYRKIIRRSDWVSPLPVMMLWITAYWVVLHLGTFGTSRFHYPMMPFFIMYGAAMLTGFTGLKSKDTTDNIPTVAEC